MANPSFRHAVAAAVLLAIGAGTTASAQSYGTATPNPAAKGSDTAKATSALSSADRDFMTKAAAGGMAEVQLGELAQKNAASDAVKQFGQRMAQDHGKAGEELKQLASAKGVQLPTALDRKHTQDMARLQKLSGADFDREYMKHMVDDHKKDVGEFQKQAKSGRDEQIKSYASKTLPTLQDHLKQAQTVSDQVVGATTGKGAKPAKPAS